MRLHPPSAFLCLALLPAAVWTSTAQAAIPQGYTGTPYMGTPQSIPGRVELAALDEGGLNVAFYADHRRENAVQEGYAPISGDDYRPGNLNLPNICKTNKLLEPGGIGSEDFWEDGTRYPSEGGAAEYYMGYAHTVDWVRVTVNVAQAGTYNVSSNWACANPNCGLSIWFNDGSAAGGDMDGQNKSGVVMLQGTNDYHKWRKYPNFAKVTLSAGPQLMTFHVEVANHLQYGFLQFDLEGGGGSGSGGTSAGGAASGGSGSGGASATGGVTGGGGVTASGGSTGVGGSAATGGVSQSTAGAPTGLPAAGTGSSAGGSGATAPAAGSAQDSSGCAFAPSSSTSRSSFAGLGLLLASSLLLRRRRASRA